MVASATRGAVLRLDHGHGVSGAIVARPPQPRNRRAGAGAARGRRSRATNQIVCVINGNILFHYIVII